MMLGWAKKIFGISAAPPASPAPTQAFPANTAMAQRIAAANLTPKTVWSLIERGDLKGLQELIAKDPAQLNATTKTAIRKRINLKMKPVHYAAYLGQEAALVLLHQNGADINEKAQNDYTCLHLAGRSKAGGVAAAYLLEKSTIDVNALSAHGTTALMEAARSGNQTAVREMLEKNAKTDLVTPQSPAAIGLAARNGHFGIVKLLAENGANINAPDSLLRRPLWQATLERREDIADYLLEKGAATDGSDLQGVTLLMVAAQRGNAKLLATLLAAGHDPNDRDNNGNTALHYACYDETADNARQVAELLIGHGAWIDAKNKMGEDPLGYARSKGRTTRTLIACLEAAQDDPAAVRTPSINDVFSAGAKREVKVMKTLTLRAPETPAAKLAR